MTYITIGRHAKAAIEINQWLRNGKVPVAELQNRLAELAGFWAYVRPKLLFTRAVPIASIPASAAGTRTRWRWGWRSGPYAKTVCVLLEMALQSNGTETDPYGLLQVKDGAGTVIGHSMIHYGSSSAALDYPLYFGGGVSGIIDPNITDPTLVDITPDTDYYGTISDVDYARIVSATVWEISLTPNTDAGYPEISKGAGAPILDTDRSTVVAMSRTLWKKGGQPLISWCSETDATAPSSALGDLSGVLAQTISAPSLVATGTAGTSAPSVFSVGALSTGGSTYAWPSHASGDIGLLIGVTDNGVTPTVFWTDAAQVADSPQSYEDTALVAYWCRATSGSMAAPSTIGAQATWTMLVIRGCVASGTPYDDTAGDGGAAANVTVPGLTTTTANALVIAICGMNDATGPNFSGEANASLTSLTEVVDDAGSEGSSLGVWSGVKATAGTVNATTATHSGSVAQARISIAFKP